jgi:hypothetical protein
MTAQPDRSEADVRIWLFATAATLLVGLAVGAVGAALPLNPACDPTKVATVLVRVSEIVLACCALSGFAGALMGTKARGWFGLLMVAAPIGFVAILLWHLSAQPSTPGCNWQL